MVVFGYNKTYMTAQEIRQKYLEFLQARDHVAIPRANLVPQDDPTTLFTGSGMQPLLPYLLGEEHPKGVRLTDSQTCLRAEDIEEVGDNRHTTFFEMLGNWSLGDYFKEEQLRWFFEFLVDEVGLDPNRLYVSCFIGNEKLGLPKDEESANIWQKLFAERGVDAMIVTIGSQADGDRIGMQGGRIFYYDEEENWWSRTGSPDQMPAGEPGGPDSEVFYDFGEREHDESYGEPHPATESGRFLEIGNSVFMQYQKTDDGFKQLPKQNVDFGGGLERIAAAAIDSPDIFQISLLKPIIDGLEEMSDKSYNEHAQAMRVIADHLRAAVFLAADGVAPSNKEQGYVARRLMRRAIKFAFDLDIEQDLVVRSAPLVIESYKDDFQELENRQDEILDILKKEESVFRQTLRKGLRELEKMVNHRLKEAGNIKNVEIAGDDVFVLYDTFGFPAELTAEEVSRLGAKLSDNWIQDFEHKLDEQRERSRTASKGQFKGGLSGSGDVHKKYHTATHLLYRVLREVLGDHVVQHGSNITDERLRFDFSHPEKMTAEQKQAVEQIVNERIDKDLYVSWEELPTDEAMRRGAYGAFGDTYGDTVKVYSMKDDNGKLYSFEICGGPHVSRTSELAADGKRFKIKKEESSSAGIRRIKAVLV